MVFFSHNPLVYGDEKKLLQGLCVFYRGGGTSILEVICASLGLMRKSIFNMFSTAVTQRPPKLKNCIETAENVLLTSLTVRASLCTSFLHFWGLPSHFIAVLDSSWWAFASRYGKELTIGPSVTHWQQLKQHTTKELTEAHLVKGIREKTTYKV